MVKYCAKCGTSLEEDANFCNICGKKQDDASQSQPQAAQRQWQPQPQYQAQATQPQWQPMQQQRSQWQHSSAGTEIKRSNANKSTIAATLIAAVFEMISGAAMVGAYFYIGDLAKKYWYRGGSSYAELRPLIMFFAVALFGIGFIQILKAIATSKSFVCVCEEGVYGVAGKAFYFATQPFEVAFSQITNVGKGSLMLGNIRIDCGPNTYGCLIAEPQEIIECIAEKINQKNRIAYGGKTY